MNRGRLNYILENAVNGYPLSDEDILFLLSAKERESIRQVMSSAMRVREQYFGDKIFLYGFIYTSTYCRNHCAFCFYRKENRKSPRYRKGLDEVVVIARELADSGVHLIDLTMGEDPVMHRTGRFEELVEMVRDVKRETGLPVMISPGVVPDETLETLAEQHTDWYALYQETHNPDRYARLRIGQSFEKRYRARWSARQYGMLVEDGFLLGVGETSTDRAQSIATMKRDNVDQARVMSFVPQAETPFAEKMSPPREEECLSIAVMRLTMPDRLIPASLDVDGIKGLQMRLQAGANVVTSIIPPSRGLAGVSQSVLDIDQGLRTVSEVKRIVSPMGLRASNSDGYKGWVASRRTVHTRERRKTYENRRSGRTTSGT